MSKIVSEVTWLFPVSVAQIFEPTSIKEIQEIILRESWRISVGWGRYSMGGQTAITDGVQIDMRSMNRVIHFDPDKKTITVEAGITWRDIQDVIDPHGLSVMTMQTYANFTVGGSLSVNVHGRYIGFGPLILSVLSIRIILADGSDILASRGEHSDIFFAAIGGYGGVGVIVETTLQLRENCMLERVYQDMPIEAYGSWFREYIRDASDIVFHNADMYPPFFSKVRATSWKKTEKDSTEKTCLTRRNKSYPVHRLAYFLMTYFRTWVNCDIGKWIREKMIDPLVYHTPEVHSRNYEASYDVAELEPTTRTKTTYVLEEYFCPVDHINEFIPKMREIFTRHNVNVINISIRHALPDDGSVLAWASEEVFAFVVYYNQAITIPEKRAVAVWTRELIDAVLSVGGRYYLPYQLHGTHAQVQKAYARFDHYAQIKKQYDPLGRFSNMLLEKYYYTEEKPKTLLASRFHTVYDTEQWRDAFYIFLQNIFHIAPTSLFHSMIWDMVDEYPTDREIYENIQKNITAIQPFLANLRYGIPALYKQKNKMASQTKQLLWENKRAVYNGYLEIWGTGRYIRPISDVISIEWPQYLLSDEPIDYTPVRIAERGQMAFYNTQALTYSATDLTHISDNSLDLITIFIGLHHAPEEILSDFLNALSRKLRKGGLLLLREHDVTDSFVHNFVTAAHDIYNAGTGISWTQNERELRNFRSIDEWKEMLSQYGMYHQGWELLQLHDPTHNTLMRFDKL